MEALSAPEITPGPTRPSMKPKKTIVKEKAQIPPSQIGVQRVRELLEEAKNNKQWITKDVSDYMVLYDEWKAAKGDKDTKKANLSALREIYKRALYKK